MFGSGRCLPPQLQYAVGKRSSGIPGSRSVGIILTGMGRDGAKMAGIKAAGGQTLAQDEASSVVFGMNRVAIENGDVDRILPLDEIAGAMMRLADKVPWP